MVAIQLPPLNINALVSQLLCTSLRIPAIHGAKTTKNQTPIARLAQ